ncbi:MAG TPA: ATPase [Flavobacterium sp.]|nr:ATPase [Flavobacterium sp.]
MKIPNNIIQREHYLDKIIPFVGKNLIKVFTGQRRVGKSYFLFQLIYFLQQKGENSILYINKEDIAFSFIKNATDLHDYIIAKKSKKTKTYVFIDEIQDILNFEDALRSLLLYEDLDLYCTGSNANLLSSDIAGYLSGRYIETIIYSLDYSEFIQFHKLEDSSSTLELFLKYGGLPYLKNLDLTDEIVFEYLKNIYNTIVYRDIINRYKVRNTLFLEQLVLFLSGNTGSIFSSKKISDFLKSQKINIPTSQVQLYISYLVNAFLVHKVARYDIVGKRIFEIGEKYYFENLGIRNSIWGYRVEDKGKILENVIYNHLLYKGYKVNIGVLGANEIDFVCEKNGEKLYIQVALSLFETQTIEREFGNLLKIKDNYNKIVITLDTFNGNTYNGIETMDLKQFLLS